MLGANPSPNHKVSLQATYGKAPLKARSGTQGAVNHSGFKESEAWQFFARTELSVSCRFFEVGSSKGVADVSASKGLGEPKGHIGDLFFLAIEFQLLRVRLRQRLRPLSIRRRLIVISFFAFISFNSV